MSERVRYMRLLVFFDLPVKMPGQRREYARFRRYLTKNGYVMLQKSVYSRLAIDGKMAEILMSNLARNKPPDGLVQVLRVTEKQFARSGTWSGSRRRQTS